MRYGPAWEPQRPYLSCGRSLCVAKRSNSSTAIGGRVAAKGPHRDISDASGSELIKDL